MHTKNNGIISGQYTLSPLSPLGKNRRILNLRKSVYNSSPLSGLKYAFYVFITCKNAQKQLFYTNFNIQYYRITSTKVVTVNYPSGNSSSLISAIYFGNYYPLLSGYNTQCVYNIIHSVAYKKNHIHI